VAVMLPSHANILTNESEEMQKWHPDVDPHDSQMYLCYICETYTRFQLTCQKCAAYLVGIPMCKECFDELHGDCARSKDPERPSETRVRRPTIGEFICDNCDIRSTEVLVGQGMSGSSARLHKEHCGFLSPDAPEVIGCAILTPFSWVVYGYIIFGTTQTRMLHNIQF
jgi:hypothetical protein